MGNGDDNVLPLKSTANTSNEAENVITNIFEHCYVNYVAILMCLENGHKEVLIHEFLGSFSISRSVHQLSTQFCQSFLADALEQRFLNAAEYCDLKEVVACLEAKVNPNCLNLDGFTALHIAAERDDVLLALVLLTSKDIVIDTTSRHGYTALYFACRLGQNRVLKLLLKNGANPNSRDRFGKAPLHVAATLGSVVMAQTLFRFKASVNILDNMNISPLYISIVEQCFAPMTRLLLRHGANPCLAIGNTPLFLECVVACHTPQSMESTLLLLDHGEDVNVLDKIARRNALHYLAISEYVPLAVELFNRGCNPFAIDFMRNTPLEVALYHENYHIAYYLQTFMCKVEDLEFPDEDEDEDDEMMDPFPTTSGNEPRKRKVSFFDGTYAPRVSLISWDEDSESEEERQRRSTLLSNQGNAADQGSSS